MKDFSWCGLSVNFKNGLLVSYEDEVECEDHRSVSIENVRDFLLNDDLRYPKVVYNRLAGVGIKKHKKNWKKYRHDMIFLSLGVAGIEFVKTEGWKYVSKGKDVPVLFETVLGSVSLILQKNGSCFKRSGILGDDEFFCADKVVVIRVPRGRKVLVPPGYYIVVVNNTLNPAAVSIVVDKDAEEVSAPFSQSRGAAYYAIKKNARLEMVPNPLYRGLHPIKRLRPESVWEQIKRAELQDLLYVFLSRGHKFFEEVLSSEVDLE